MAAPVRARLLLPLLLVCVSLLPGVSARRAAAQSTLGTIRGAVRDPNDQVVAGAADRAQGGLRGGAPCR